ncbi:terminase small subunit [Clostridium saccharobutylicum]|uniref:terminase small subunit n=1 Tax=Clostridium saccharobutylicum TaxID=169679 RepID=UPI00098CC3D3|nr:terminase small subunit [Clostridium saccharobutylicum]OOM17188.1 terminase small subunit [Clostridium saccharobutylicum]
MPRVRSPERDKAKELYIQHNGEITNREIANILNISEKTVSGWKVKDKWNGESNGVLQKKIRSTPNKKTKKDTTPKEPINEVVKELSKNNELTEQQKDFCMYYVKYRNKTTAYKKAYNCSYRNAHANAYKLWQNMAIKKEIDRQLEEIRNGVLFDIRDLIQINLDIAFSDMKDYTEWGKKEVEVDKDEEGNPIKVDVNYVDFKDSSEVDGTLISEVKKGKDGVSIKLQDKGKAIDFLYKHLIYVSEEDKRKLERANKEYQNNKLKEEISNLQGDSSTDKEVIRIVDDI